MTSIHVILKEADDDASSGFFHLKYHCDTGAGLSRDARSSCLFQTAQCQCCSEIKKATQAASSDASGKAKDEDPDSAVSRNVFPRK
ncbi:hypothetical protein [Salisediminibacterium halotolerans]|uniref:hypothetical protein n=1 Tax=Salisediminibacterium halotolerans TaxID=517425 RepID=UPI0013157A90|nr:hypothetical protein [Salisediminibacterium halotolerans]